MSRRGLLAGAAVVLVILLMVGVMAIERRGDGSLEELRADASSRPRVTWKAPAAGRTSSSPSMLPSIRRPPPAPLPTLTGVAGGGSGSEDPSDAVGEEESGDICDEDIDAIVELCDPARSMSDCAGVAAEEAAACQAGCVMQTCRKLRDCAKPDPPWCGSPCDDACGGLFWQNFWGAHYPCKWQFGDEQPALGDCTTASMEESCPELAGMGWASRFRGLY